MTFFNPTRDFNFTDKTIVIPIVSTANVPQLAVDLLISSLSLEHVGTFDSRHLVPVVGDRENAEEGITTPLELYGKEGVTIVVTQQRSPVLKSRKQEFTQAFLAFIHSSSFTACVFMTGVDMSNRTDSQMLTPTYYVVPPASPSIASSPLAAISELHIPKYTSPVTQHPGLMVEGDLIPFVPGGGLTRRILTSIPQGWQIPTVSLLQFVVEGDNRADANLFAAVVAKVLEVDSLLKEWKQPTSWKQGLFGTVHDQSLYG